MDNIELSIVIPCYNEEQNIRLGALDKVALYLEKQKFSQEVLIVDDGSTDKSRELIKKFTKTNKQFHLIENQHQGKAATVVSGIMIAKGANILFADLDQATPIDQLEKLLPWLEKDYDIVIGSRQGRREGAPFIRKLMGPGFILIRNVISGLKGINDTQCGFKLFKKEAARQVFPKLLIYKQNKSISGPRVTAGFDVEMLFIAQKLGYRIKEVPVEWHYVDTRRVSPIADSLDALVDMIKIRYLSLIGKYR
jgi:dolichyl-phosphate beta-glucosyltransferase